MTRGLATLAALAALIAGVASLGGGVAGVLAGGTDGLPAGALGAVLIAGGLALWTLGVKLVKFRRPPNGVAPPVARDSIELG